MKNSIQIKSSWDEITLSEFIVLSEIETNKDLERRPLKKSLERISVLTGMNEEELEELDGATFGHLIEKSKFLDVEPATLFSENATFEINGVEYGYRKPGDLSTGEYISIEASIANALENKRSILPELLAVLIRPTVETPNAEFGAIKEIQKFDNKSFVKRVEFFKRNLRVPFFIHALNRITNGVNGTNEAVEAFTNKGNITKKANK